MYCLDWASLNVTEPDGILDFLLDIGAALDDSPPVLRATAVDVPGQQIWMDVGVAQDGCAASGDFAWQELTANGPGSLVGFHFEAGPGDMTFGGGSISLILQAADVTGDYSPTYDRIVDGSIVGALDLSPAIGACALLPCGPCPDGGNQCVGFVADSATWNLAD